MLNSNLMLWTVTPSYTYRYRCGSWNMIPWICYFRRWFLLMSYCALETKILVPLIESTIHISLAQFAIASFPSIENTQEVPFNVEFAAQESQDACLQSLPANFEPWKSGKRLLPNVDLRTILRTASIRVLVTNLRVTFSSTLYFDLILLQQVFHDLF